MVLLLPVSRNGHQLLRELVRVLLFGALRGRGTKKGYALCLFLRRNESKEQSAYLYSYNIFIYLLYLSLSCITHHCHLLNCYVRGYGEEEVFGVRRIVSGTKVV